MESLNEIGINMQHIVINPKIVWITILVVLIIFLITSSFIFYHWSTYGYNSKTTSLAIKIYSIGSILFILTGIMGAIIYTSSL